MNLFDRRRVLWDYLGGALWVRPTVSAPLFLTAEAMLSRVSVDADSPLWPLAFQGTAEDAHGILVVEAVEPTEQPRWRAGRRWPQTRRRLTRRREYRRYTFGGVPGSLVGAV